MQELFADSCKLTFQTGDVGGAQNDQAGRVSSLQTASLGRVYFVYTKQFSDKTFQGIIDQLPLFQAMKIGTLWISPVHPQTTQEMRGTINDHNYWWSDPAAVGEDLGGEAKFIELVEKAKAVGIRIGLDTVLDHGGYAEHLRMSYQNQDSTWVNKVLNTNDPAYFRQEYIPAKFYDEFDSAQTPEDVLKYLDLISRYQWDPELPVFNHRNPEIFDWLVFSYKRFVDMGVRVFRLDAAKHIPVEFLIKFMNTMNDYASTKHSQKLTFLMEYFSPTYQIMDTIVNRIHRSVSPGVELYFLDFPASFEARRLVTEDGYSFSHFQGFIEWRENGSHPLEMYVPMLEDHDAMHPFKTQFDSVMLHLLAGFFSHHPVGLYHGGEVGGNREKSRSMITAIDPSGEVIKASNMLAEFFAKTSWQPESATTFFHRADHDSLVAEKRMNGTSVFLVIHRSKGPVSMMSKITSQRGLHPTNATVLYDYSPDGQLNATLTKDHVTLTTSGPTVAMFTVEYKIH